VRATVPPSALGRAPAQEPAGASEGSRCAAPRPGEQATPAAQPAVDPYSQARRPAAVLRKGMTAGGARLAQRSLLAAYMHEGMECMDALAITHSGTPACGSADSTICLTMV